MYIQTISKMKREQKTENNKNNKKTWDLGMLWLTRVSILAVFLRQVVLQRRTAKDCWKWMKQRNLSYNERRYKEIF